MNLLLHPKSVFPTECKIDHKNQAKLQRHVCFEIGADLKNKAFLRREVEQEAKGEA